LKQIADKWKTRLCGQFRALFGAAPLKRLLSRGPIEAPPTPLCSS
jgi:hypothetical protein